MKGFPMPAQVKASAAGPAKVPVQISTKVRTAELRAAELRAAELRAAEIRT
jgi:hypothetical protein